MEAEGPQLETLLHRLTDCPPEFWESGQTGSGWPATLTAVLCDLLRAVDSQRPPELDGFADQLRELSQPQLGLLSVVSWLLYDSWFVSRPELAGPIRQLFTSRELSQLATLVSPRTLVEDADRREELVRICLQQLGFRPHGETQEQAADRLTALDSVERERVMRAAAQAERRARQIREQMAAQAARDAASRYGE